MPERPVLDLKTPATVQLTPEQEGAYHSDLLHMLLTICFCH